MDGAVFTISLDGHLMAVETLRLGEEAGSLLVFSELVHNDAMRATERRIVVLSEVQNPLHYDLEISALGARSVWVGERQGDAIDCLNNNLAWFGPVLVEGVSPAPEVMLEAAPSALPYALLALRDFGLEGALRVNALDIQADLPESRALDLAIDANRRGAVIGTMAIEGRWDGDDGVAFTMWVHPGSRALYSVEIPEHRYGPWGQPRGGDRAEPGLSAGPTGAVVIERVGAPPALPTPAPPVGEATRTSVEFASRDGTRLAGTLITPQGEGPFPGVVLLGPGGIEPRWDPGDALARRGWAALTYDKRGLGESQGEFVRDRPELQAEDAVAAVAMLRDRPEIDPNRIVILGIGAGGLAGALAVSGDDAAAVPAVAAAVLASAPGPGPVFPDLALHRIRGVLAPYYGWGEEETARYEQLSVSRWQEWLFEGTDEVTLLRRRISLRPLHDLAGLDLARELSGAGAPILLLQGEDDPWLPEGAAVDLAGRLAASGRQVTAQVFEGLGHDLGRGSDPASLLAPQVDDTVWSWLDATLRP